MGDGGSGLGVKWVAAFVILVLLVIVVFQVAVDPTREIPDPYYQAIGPNITSEAELRQSLPLLEGEYKENYFDCSEMAALIEWYLEGRGVDTRIITGARNMPHDVVVGGFEYKNSTGDHAWVVSNISGKVFLIEPTIARIVPESLEQYYIPDGSYSDIYEVVDSSRCADEYDWWTVVEIVSPLPFPTPIRLPRVSRLESDLFDLANSEREKDGFSALKWNSEIAGAARAHSKGLASAGGDDLKHAPADILRDNDIYYFDITVSRTLSMPGPAYNYDEFLRNCIDAWDSNESGPQTPEHDFDESGVGAAVDPDGTVYFTQVSIRRIHCGYKNAPCCTEQGYYPWCYKPWKCNRGICK
ncbi:MAG: CAP domain-containing protein [Euryarchaeota archaeon]|nr:CAP domain-containing protein [Euryarchaeota archaeon]